MFESLYENKNRPVSREDFEHLYEEYHTLREDCSQLRKRYESIIKISDKQFHNQRNHNDIYQRNANRFNVILKHSDKQGAKIMDEKGTLEEELEVELQKEQHLLNEIEDTQKEIVYTLGTIGESRSRETGNHVRRVAEYSKLLALYAGISEDDAEMLRIASPMHDIGKVATPDCILNKPGKLNLEEFEVMKEHASRGYDILKYSSRPILKTAAIVANEHHEKYDGTGYPNALQGEEIHIFGRITAVADVFDALGSDRIYKKAWPDEEIFAFFHKENAKHFDPKLVEIFFEHLEEFLAIRDKFQDFPSRREVL